MFALVPLALLFVARPALSQEDALEQPYEGTNPPPTQPAPSERAPNGKAPGEPPKAGDVSGVVREPPRVDDRPAGPVRARRRLALTGELGWNGIAGFGPVISYHVVPQFTVELGAGLSFTGWKGGVRGRYNLLTGSVSPFIGAGFMGTSGFGEVTGDFDESRSSTGGEQVTIRVRPSAFFQAVGGIDWTSSGGFTLISAIGWCAVLNDNLDIVAGTPTYDERKAFDVAFRSGPVITVATGYTFQ